ncbi:hypothetical protein B0H14DRAFT_2930287, partial [Mycena olivaceomarginata]
HVIFPLASLQVLAAHLLSRSSRECWRCRAQLFCDNQAGIQAQACSSVGRLRAPPSAHFEVEPKFETEAAAESSVLIVLEQFLNHFLGVPSTPSQND